MDGAARSFPGFAAASDVPMELDGTESESFAAERERVAPGAAPGFAEWQSSRLSIM
ncbi:hypothetical protein GCM10023321_09140 [Pseudonocardia eucalypti]|uniref:Uncharacterized protein n=1 Tax=Pseudonocardia eucalypti TaxID=648755 RepID=A0ABP9PPQ7_9PSEU